MNDRWIEEFTYRGRPPGANAPPAWHVIVGVMVDDGLGGKVPVLRGPLTPAEAEALGFSLSVIEAEINHEALAERDRLATELAAARRALKAADAANEAAGDLIVELATAHRELERMRPAEAKAAALERRLAASNRNKDG